MKKKCILIVEDESITAEDIKNMLTELDYDVAGIASSASTAILRARQTRPDLVLMDIVLKGKKDGIDAASRIRTELNIPVVYLTAYGDETIIERAKLTGPYGYIIKPFTKRELHSNVEIALHKKDMERRIEHLNAVLAAIRGVNQLITHERDRDTLLQQSCDKLIETRGYHDAIVILRDSRENLSWVFEAGLDEDMDIFMESVEREALPGCMRRALAKPGLIAMENPAASCKYCPLMAADAGKGRLVMRLEKNGNIYGLLSVSVPQSMASDAEERSLFEEVAGDIAFALFGMEQEKKKRKAEIGLIESEEKLRSTLASMDDLVFTIDLNGVFLGYHQPMKADTLYVPPETFIGRSYREIMPPDTVDPIEAAISEVVSTGSVQQVEYAMEMPTGKSWYNAKLSPLRKDKAELVGITAVVRDITENKIAEELMRQSEEKYRVLVEGTSDYIYMVDLEGKVLSVNESGAGLLRNKPHEIEGRFLSELFPKEISEDYMTGLNEVAQTGASRTTISKLVFGESELWLDTNLNPLTDRNGKVTAVIGLSRDVTERKRMEQSLRESEELNRAIIDSSHDCIQVMDLDGNLMSMSAGGQKLLEIEDIELFLNRSWIDFWKGEDRINAETAVMKASEGGMGYFEGYCPSNKGTPKWWGIIISPILDKDGNVDRLLAVSRDITERKKAEEVLRTREAQLSNAMMIAKLGDWEYDVDDDMFTFSDHFYNIFRTTAEIVGGYRMSSEQYATRFLHPDDRSLVGIEVQKALETTDPDYYGQLEHRIIYSDGEIGYISVRFFLVKDSHGRTVKTFGANQDITERRRAVDALRDSENSLTEAQRIAHLGSWSWDLKTELLHWSDEMYRIFGLEPGARDLSYEDFLDFVHPEFRQTVKEGVGASLDTGETFNVEYKIVTAKGSERWVHARGEVHYDDGGAPSAMAGTVLDITSRKQAETELKQAYDELKRAQAHLIQSEKLAGMGTMAAGVAHEINNPLQVIMGMSELLMEGDDIEQVREDAREILAASDKIKSIVKNLSIYSRDAKTLRILPFDLNEVIRKSVSVARYSTKFLDIGVRLDQGELPEMVGNPGEIQQVFINLITNAVDAMEDSGLLSIRTCHEGNSIRVEVSDTGKGIPADEMNRIFDPFFTTKEVGKGTGLGLHVIHEIVKKYNGKIEVESEVGEGTTFRMEFPTTG